MKCYSVINRYKSMKDFVTSSTDESIFNTFEECEEYIKNFNAIHPNRCFHQIKQIEGDYQKLVYLQRNPNNYLIDIIDTMGKCLFTGSYQECNKTVEQNNWHIY